MEDRLHLDKLTSSYIFKIIMAFKEDASRCGKSIEVIAKAVHEIYRFFEPAFFQDNFFLIKNFDDEFIFPKSTGELLWNKGILINRTSGDFAIQLFENGEAYIFNDFNPTTIYEAGSTLSYRFNQDKDSYIANSNEIDIPSEGKGSNYAPYFRNLLKALQDYNNERVYHSTCGKFRESWNDPKYIAFIGEGPGNNIPEKYMQESLHDYLRTQESLRGINFECAREHPTNSDKPKPVDIRMLWREANRHALIEIKYVGLVINKRTGKGRVQADQSTFDKGYFQVKGYYDSTRKDYPTTIAKAHLVVIDGRRANIDESSTSVSYVDGMHYKDSDVEVSEDKRYYKLNPAFEKPIRMFAAPVTT